MFPVIIVRINGVAACAIGGDVAGGNSGSHQSWYDAIHGGVDDMYDGP